MSPGEYSPSEQRFINFLGLFAICLVLLMIVKLLLACARADFTHDTEIREIQSSQEHTEK